MKIKIIFLIALSLSLSFCNYTKLKHKGTVATSRYKLSQEKLTQLSFSLIYQRIILPKCVSCHGSSGKVNLESYPEVVKNMALIKKSVFEEKTMPKKNNLSEEEFAYLWNWIEIGYPEVATSGYKYPEPEPLRATYESINKNIFSIYCNDCHSPQGSGKRVPLDLDSLINSPLELVLPENPDESGLVLSVERKDHKRMPPAKEGYAELKEEMKVIIREWIENGAKD